MNNTSIIGFGIVIAIALAITVWIIAEFGLILGMFAALAISYIFRKLVRAMYGQK